MNESFDIKSNAWISYILFSSLFYYLIFQIRLYRHHFLSIVLIVLLGIAIVLIAQNIQNEIIKEPIKLAMKLMKEIYFSMYTVIGKYVMEKKYVSVYELSFYVGLFHLLTLLIFSIFDYYFLKWTPFEKFFNNFNYKKILLILGIIITQIGINITTLLTSKNNSPCHIFIILVFGQLAYYAKFTGLFLLVVVLLIIILFLSLIFNEIIEINICNLSYHTKRNIAKRAAIEARSQNESDKEKENRKDSEIETVIENEYQSEGETINENEENLIEIINT